MFVIYFHKMYSKKKSLINKLKAFLANMHLPFFFSNRQDRQHCESCDGKLTIYCLGCKVSHCIWTHGELLELREWSKHTKDLTVFCVVKQKWFLCAEQRARVNSTQKLTSQYFTSIECWQNNNIPWARIPYR